jgi:hypothetical protein
LIDLQDVMVVDVDDLSTIIAGGPPGVKVVEMYVTVEKVPRSEAPHKPEEGFESAMGGIVLVVYAQRWGVGHENVEIASMEQLVPEEPRHELYDSPEHLPFGKLVGSVIVPDAPS